MAHLGFRWFSWSVIAGVVFVSGCAAGGGFQQPALPQSRSAQPQLIAAQPGNSSAATTHFLYVASKDLLEIYALPLNAASKPVHTISGFRFAVGVAVGTANINVIDQRNAGEGLDVYYASGANALKKRCAVKATAPEGIAYRSDALYLTSNSLGNVARFADTESSSAKPQPCTGEAPVSDSNGLFNPLSVSANGQFVYVGDAGSGTLDAYPIPLTSGEAPKFTVDLGFAPSGLVASNTDVYVAGSNAVDDFKLPLSGAAPLKLSKAPLREPFGLALYPRPSVSPPIELIVSDVGATALFVYKLPLTANETPSVTLTTGRLLLGLDAK